MRYAAQVVPCLQSKQPNWSSASMRWVLQPQRSPEGTWRRCKSGGRASLPHEHKIRWYKIHTHTLNSLTSAKKKKKRLLWRCLTSRVTSLIWCFAFNKKLKLSVTTTRWYSRRHYWKMNHCGWHSVTTSRLFPDFRDVHILFLLLCSKWHTRYAGPHWMYPGCI